ncbi:MAG: hypothetical protein H7067_02055 [Burkholderiales bacterium]|nr:hypothetical protein [Opitutaceae bacterium]
MATETPPESSIITAKIPEPLLNDLRQIAKAEGRSLSSQVRLFLAESVTRKNTARPEHPGQTAAAA